MKRTKEVVFHFVIFSVQDSTKLETRRQKYLINQRK